MILGTIALDGVLFFCDSILESISHRAEFKALIVYEVYIIINMAMIFYHPNKLLVLKFQFMNGNLY